MSTRSIAREQARNKAQVPLDSELLGGRDAIEKKYLFFDLRSMPQPCRHSDGSPQSGFDCKTIRDLTLDYPRCGVETILRHVLLCDSCERPSCSGGSGIEGV